MYEDIFKIIAYFDPFAPTDLECSDIILSNFPSWELTEETFCHTFNYYLLEELFKYHCIDLNKLVSKTYFCNKTKYRITSFFRGRTHWGGNESVSVLIRNKNDSLSIFIDSVTAYEDGDSIGSIKLFDLLNARFIKQAGIQAVDLTDDFVKFFLKNIDIVTIRDAIRDSDGDILFDEEMYIDYENIRYLTRQIFCYFKN